VPRREGRGRATGAHRRGAKAARERADTCGMVGVIGRVAGECKWPLAKPILAFGTNQTIGEFGQTPSQRSDFNCC